MAEQQQTAPPVEAAPEESPYRPSIRRDASLPALLAGLVCVAVSFSGPLVVVLAAAAAGHLDQAHTASWIWAVSIGSGLTCLLLSWWTRTPVITAWSTPGAALLVSSLGEYPYREAVGAFVVSSVAVALFGVTGLFGRLIRAIPTGIVNAMLAGILFTFGAGIFTSLRGAPVLVLGSFTAFLVAKRFVPRYAVPVALLAGALLAAATVGLPLHLGDGGPTRPVFTAPAFSWPAMVGLALPLTIVALASQNAPGLGIMRASGYQPDDRLLIGATGGLSVLLAPFGSPGVNLAAITAAICTSPESHPDPRRRYIAGMSAGFLYLVVGSFGGVLVSLFTGLPTALIAVIAGVALLGSFQGSLAGAAADEAGRDGAVVTFLAAASGMSLFGIGSAFWGLLLGLATHLVLRARKANSA
ncbi:benzoate/H(+) symporter BenE family transporter [Kitasatospora atroaurantiaca]|uniref:Benzoate membrane transport protein n=1 Tax=Kitasatospora atroaurantiaca TaxID=285545 RepID=A0A561ESE3_9ACTN|nr:benzoate/H(+) symporter BenE family transporter [Kitasatospora atroaurantiaca]TWE18538.1 benzoate membrane transport protein [Kitasatospora atroaurantiaca]